MNEISQRASVTLHEKLTKTEKSLIEEMCESFQKQIDTLERDHTIVFTKELKEPPSLFIKRYLSLNRVSFNLTDPDFSDHSYTFRLKELGA